jgi:hypothetical protein
MDYSGSYDFAATEMYWKTTHMVVPSDEALQCNDCHSDDGRMDWEALGYYGDPIRWGGRDQQGCCSAKTTRPPTNKKSVFDERSQPHLTPSKQRPSCRRPDLSLAFLAFGLTQYAGAQDAPPEFPPAPPCILTFNLLDANGQNVRDSGQPISTMNTCGGCHDAEFINRHSFHADVGRSSMTAPGGSGVAAWDTSPGLFGKWDPILYEYLSPKGDELIDLTTPEWLMLYGARHVGGGPANSAATACRSPTCSHAADNPETSIHDTVTGELITWDWEESGVVEMNCFLCHLTNPDNDARVTALQNGDFGWANTATLAATGIVTPRGTAGHTILKLFWKAAWSKRNLSAFRTRKTRTAAAATASCTPISVCR